MPSLLKWCSILNPKVQSERPKTPNHYFHQMFLEDPFEVVSKFRDLLTKNLSASHIARITAFAYSHSSHADDVFSSLLDTLSQSSMLVRLNLFFVVDALMKVLRPLCRKS